MTERSEHMKGRQTTGLNIACIGGGPAGLYLGISLKLRNPNHQVDVYEPTGLTILLAGVSSFQIRQSITFVPMTQ